MSWRGGCGGKMANEYVSTFPGLLSEYPALALGGVQSGITGGVSLYVTLGPPGTRWRGAG